MVGDRLTRQMRRPHRHEQSGSPGVQLHGLPRGGRLGRRPAAPPADRRRRRPLACLWRSRPGSAAGMDLRLLLASSCGLERGDLVRVLACSRAAPAASASLAFGLVDLRLERVGLRLAAAVLSMLRLMAMPPPMAPTTMNAAEPDEDHGQPLLVLVLRRGRAAAARAPGGPSSRRGAPGPRPRRGRAGRWPPAWPRSRPGVAAPRRSGAGARLPRRACGLLPPPGAGAARRAGAAPRRVRAARPRPSPAPRDSARRAGSPGWRPSPRFLAVPPWCSLPARPPPPTRVVSAMHVQATDLSRPSQTLRAPARFACAR